MNKSKLLFGMLAASATVITQAVASDNVAVDLQPKLNVVLMLGDNLGYGSLAILRRDL